MGRAKVKGIFCLEGDWDSDLRTKVSIEPVLELLERADDPSVPYIHRDIGTETEFRHYLKKWTQRAYARYPILYLGFHGSPGTLHVGDGRSAPFTFEALEELLEGRCKGRVVIFGSCGTLGIHGREINRFLKVTGALAVCGYKADAIWLLSAALEMILLSGFQLNAFTKPGMSAVRRRVLREAAGLAKELDFRMEIAR
jgi:hypothetical protein